MCLEAHNIIHRNYRCYSNLYYGLVLLPKIALKWKQSIKNISVFNFRSGDVAAKYAVAAIKKKFYSDNPHVVLYALMVTYY